MQSFIQLDFRLPLLGVSCTGVPPSIVSRLTTGSFFLLRSFACLEAVMSSPDMAVIESPALARMFARVGLPPSVLGRACLEVSLFVTGEIHAGFSPSPHGFGQLDSTVVILKVMDSESTLLLRAFCRSGSLASVLSTARPDPSFFSLDCSEFESFSLIRGSACPGILVSILHCACLEFLVLAHNFGRCASRLSVFGTSRLESSLFVLDSLHSESFTLLQSLSWSALLMFVPSFVHLEPLLLAKSNACLSSCFSVYGSGQAGFQLPTLDILELDSPMAPQRSGWIGSVPSLFDFCKIDPLLFAKTCACPGILISPCGSVCMPQVLSTCHFTHMGAMTLLKKLVHLEAPLSFFSRLRIGSSLVVLDNAHLALSMLLHRSV